MCQMPKIKLHLLQYHSINGIVRSYVLLLLFSHPSPSIYLSSLMSFEDSLTIDIASIISVRKKKTIDIAIVAASSKGDPKEHDKEYKEDKIVIH